MYLKMTDAEVRVLMFIVAASVALVVYGMLLNLGFPLVIGLFLWWAVGNYASVEKEEVNEALD